MTRDEAVTYLLAYLQARRQLVIDADGKPLSKLYEAINLALYDMGIIEELRKERDAAMDVALEALHQNTPSAQPERKTGRWIDRGYMKVVYRCSECGGYSIGGKDNYCPNCGADMRGEQ